MTGYNAREAAWDDALIEMNLAGGDTRGMASSVYGPGANDTAYLLMPTSLRASVDAAGRALLQIHSASILFAIGKLTPTEARLSVDKAEAAVSKGDQGIWALGIAC